MLLRRRDVGLVGSAQFLIGLAFLQTLQDVIFQTQLRNNMGVLQTELRVSTSPSRLIGHLQDAQ